MNPSLLQSGFLNAYPFDPAGMNSDEMALKEIKNGRLAMVSGIMRTSSPNANMLKTDYYITDLIGRSGF